MKFQTNGKRLKREVNIGVNMNRESLRLLVSNNLKMTSSKNLQSEFVDEAKLAKNCAKYEMIMMVIMMCASSKIIYKRLEAVVEAN